MVGGEEPTDLDFHKTGESQRGIVALGSIAVLTDGDDL